MKMNYMLPNIQLLDVDDNDTPFMSTSGTIDGGNTAPQNMENGFSVNSN